MIQDFFDWVADLITKFVGQLPVAPFSFDSYITTFHQYSGVINYFVPFYLFSEVFNLWVSAIFICCVVLLIIRAIRSRGFK